MDGAEKAVQGAITALAAQYQIDKNAITLQEYQSVEWPDGCLGFQKVGCYVCDACDRWLPDHING